MSNKIQECKNPDHVTGWYCPDDACVVNVVHVTPEQHDTETDHERDFGDWIVDPETGAKS